MEWKGVIDKYYVLAEEVGIGVSASGSDWGVLLSAKPNHILAKNHFEDANLTAVQPKYDHEETIATIAVETDKRLMIQADVSDSWGPSDGVLDIEVPDAEMWYLAANTVVGTRIDKLALVPGLLETSGEAKFLRNDAPRLQFVLAGAIARYQLQRYKCEVVIQGLRPWTGLLGQILTVIEQGGTHTINTPITSIEWQVPDTEGEAPVTTIRAGFAL